VSQGEDFLRTFRFSVFANLHVHANLNRSLETLEQQCSLKIRRSFHVKILPLSHYRVTKTAVTSLHTFSTEFAFKTPRAVTRAPPPSPPCGGTKNDGSYVDTFNTGDAPLSSRTGSRSPYHYSHQSWCTGVSIRSGI
jgi:hypothetical protein